MKVSVLNQGMVTSTILLDAKDELEKGNLIAYQRVNKLSILTLGKGWKPKSILRIAMKKG